MIQYIIFDMGKTEGFDFTYNPALDENEVYPAIEVIARFRRLHAQVDKSRLLNDGSPSRALYLPLLRLTKIDYEMAKHTPEGGSARVDLSIDPQLN
jgi:hypothetical protein